MVRICIEDNGIGMDELTRAKAFGIFERGRGTDRYPGTGIGLAIVAKAAQKMGGECGVESEVDKGSQFWLELELAQGNEDQTHERGTRAQIKV